jgi:hypothetical protein
LGGVAPEVALNLSGISSVRLCFRFTVYHHDHDIPSFFLELPATFHFLPFTYFSALYYFSKFVNMTLQAIHTLLGWTTTTHLPVVMDRPELSPRDRTVKELEQILEKERVVLVRGTPTSGKTTLGQLLQHHYKHNKINGRIIPVVIFDAWECDGKDYKRKIRDEGRQEYSEFENWDFVTNGEYLLILDEGQMSYPDRLLWFGLIKRQSWQSVGQSHGPRICIRASYGSLGAGPDQTDASPLASLTAAQRVSIKKSPLHGSLNLTLFYDRDELSDVISRFTVGGGIPKLRLSEKARTRIYELTNGHLGAVYGIMYMLLEVQTRKYSYSFLSLWLLTYAND